jgi:hypothetical protein
MFYDRYSPQLHALWNSREVVDEENKKMELSKGVVFEDEHE